MKIELTRDQMFLLEALLATYSNESDEAYAQAEAIYRELSRARKADFAAWLQLQGMV